MKQALIWIKITRRRHACDSKWSASGQEFLVFGWFSQEFDAEVV